MYVSFKSISKLKKNYWDYQINVNNNYLSKIFNFFVFNFFVPIMNVEFTKNILSIVEEKKTGNNLKSNILVLKKKNIQLVSKYKICEFGCGRATVSRLLHKKKINASIYLVDNNLLTINFLKQYPFNIIGVDCLSKNLKIKPKFFDLSYSSGTFEHFKKKELKKYISNLKKISRRFIITIPVNSFFWKLGSFIRNYITDKSNILWKNETFYYDLLTIKKYFKKYKYLQLNNIYYTYLFGIKKSLVFDYQVLR